MDDMNDAERELWNANPILTSDLEQKIKSLSQGALFRILIYGDNREIRLLAAQYYDFNHGSVSALGDLSRYAKDDEIKMKSLERKRG